jgi:hypothetical protein
VDLLSRLTVHVDEELRILACQTLQNLMHGCYEWRQDVLHGFLQFLVKEIQDTTTQLLDNALRILLQLLVHWRSLVMQSSRLNARSSMCDGTDTDAAGGLAVINEHGSSAPSIRTDSLEVVLHCAEGWLF